VLDGVPIARPELVALQLFAVCREERAEVLVDRLWSMRLLSGPSVERFVEELGRRGRNGTAGLRRYLERRGPRYVPPDSGLEHRFARLMEEAGIPMLRQVDVGGDRHWTGRVDSRHATLPLVVEIQSERYHLALADRERDRNRIAALHAAGFHVIEVTDVDVWTRPQDVVARVRAAVRELTRRSDL
jgi:very-short-patch-repair endonuclease